MRQTGQPAGDPNLHLFLRIQALFLNENQADISGTGCNQRRQHGYSGR
ncbi:MAG: hypothetical protein WAO52_17685 [Prolixibacteraceae bacterium]